MFTVYFFSPPLFFLFFKKFKKIFLFFHFLAALCGLQDLSSLTRDWTQALGNESMES